jgi:lipopolysaccharide/colanic/teichoic acid biosynthesis glycosyltransferase
LELDVCYVDDYSLLLDLRIIGLAVWRVFKPAGISPAEEGTMPKFTDLNDADAR